MNCIKSLSIAALNIIRNTLHWPKISATGITYRGMLRYEWEQHIERYRPYGNMKYEDLKEITFSDVIATDVFRRRMQRELDRIALLKGRKRNVAMRMREAGLLQADNFIPVFEAVVYKESELPMAMRTFILNLGKAVYCEIVEGLKERAKNAQDSAK